MMVGFTIQNLSPNSGPEEDVFQSQNVKFHVVFVKISLKKYWSASKEYEKV